MEVACARMAIETEVMNFRGIWEVKSTELRDRLDLGGKSKGGISRMIPRFLACSAELRFTE